jgi:Signal transduction histidine kinase
MNVILGYANVLESKLDGEEATHTQAVREKAERFLELADKAEQIANVHSDTPGEGTTIDLVSHLQEVVNDQQDLYTEVEFSVETPSEVTVEDIDPDILHLAVQNLIENGVEHNDSESPSIAVTVEERENETCVKVADNGPGIPEIEQEAVGAERETKLGHSQGLGLWLTYWCTNRWGGDLRFETNETGTTVTLTIPKETGSIAADPSETGHSFL